ncbi:MAG: hypothetical protein RIS35_1009, partial [Pseudomonadota bacterium]
MSKPSPASFARARQLLKSADALVIAAGSGMSADSGLPTFRGNDGFWKAYPALGQRGTAFAEIASPAAFHEDPRLAWGFYGHRLAMYRETPPHAGYALLRGLARTLEHGAFVVTTNVDGHFQRGGFADDLIWEMHGTLHRLQCLTPCRQETWPADGFHPEVDTRACRLRNDMPRCPVCGAVARPNVLMFGDGGWVPDLADAQQRRFEQFAERISHPVVLEIGAGTALPSLRHLSRDRRWPVVRVNLDAPDVPV